MNCKYCNAETPENSKFCNQCGQSIFNAPKTRSTSKPQGKTLAIGITAAILVVVFVIIFACVSIFGSLENKLEGTWSRYDSVSQINDQVLYSFTSDGGTYTTNPGASIITNEENDEFEWYITDDDELIILWENGSYRKYAWNSDYANYYLSNNETSYWYLKSGKLYLSNSTSETGYYEYTEYVAK